VYERVLADIGDEQSIEQSLSTFSAHMKNIVEIVAQCDDRSLVLFDELGAGTDPAEGAALAIALIQHCRKNGANVAATTHYAELKLFAMRTPGVINASCEFNVETLQPTYRLLIGIPGKSNAFAISRKLGLPEHIIQDAANTVNENDANFEDVLNQLEQQRQAMEEARIEAERLRLQTEQNKKQADAYFQEMKKEREKAVAKARQEAQHIIDDARRTANAVQDELKQLRKHMLAGADLTGYNAKQAEMRRKLNEAQDKLVEKKQVEERPAPSRDPKVGDTVELLKLGTKATVLACNKDGTYRLQAGIMQINAKKEEIYLLENYNKPVIKQKPQHSGRQMRTDAAPAELDLRGMDCIEAVTVLEQYLDRAMMSKQRTIRIIHGKGTGALRSAVQAELKRSRIVKSYRLGMYGEGESGVTIAELNV
jgi:DNA mismatch repair protein MutS2